MEENKKIFIEKNLLATDRNRPRHKKYYEEFYSAEIIDAKCENIGDYNNLSNKPTTISLTQAAAIVANTAKVSFPEAPVDGKQYARINGAWQEVSASLDKAYTDTVNILAASGTVNIDFSLGIHFNITLTGNTTLTFSNYLPYKSIKVQTLQIKSASAAHTLALPAGVTFTTAIDLSATTKNNFLSVNILGTDLFQCANLVKTIV